MARNFMPQSGALAPYVVVNRDAAVAGVFSVDGLRGSVDLTTKYLTIANFNAYKTTTDGSISSINQSITALNTAVSNKAAKGANNDITSLTGLTTALGIAYGGTGGKTAAEARTNLGLTTAATTSIGTDGARIPLLNGVNTWAATQTFSGTQTIFSNVSPGGIEIGSSGTAGVAYIDLHSSGTGNDYDVRIQSNGGNNTVGRGTLSISADLVKLPALELTSPLGIAFGGTGATNAAAARSNLGLGTAATKYVGGALGNVLEVGAFGVGLDNFTAKQVADANDIIFNGFSAAGGAASVNFFDQYAGLLCITRAGGDGNGFVAQLQISGSGAMASRGRAGTTWSSWMQVYNTGNTTRASDGTLKAASPVVKLFADGSFENNNESEGCTVTRLATGQYLIEGCQGLNSDAAWGGIDGGFDIPTDRNKQPLIWLDYEVNADGSVLVKTYHRTHPDAPSFARNEIEGINDGSPIDIPSDQFVSVRVEMPIDSIWNQKQKDKEQDYQDVTE